MGFRFRRSIRLFPGLQINASRWGVSPSSGHRGAWLTLGPRGARATDGMPGTGVSYSEQSPWARPRPQLQVSELPATPGIEVTELAPVEIDVLPVPLPAPAATPETGDDDAEHGDPRLFWLAIAIVSALAVAAVVWALLV